MLRLAAPLRARAMMRLAVTLVILSPLWQPIAAQGEVAAGDSLVVTPDFASDVWLDSNQQIGLTLSRPLNPQTERLAIMIGHIDLSALFSTTSTRARYSGNTLPLPSGESELVVYIVSTSGPWTEIAKIPLRVLTRGGFHRANVKPALTLTTNGQLAFDNRAGGERAPYTGVTFNPALTTAMVNDNGSFELQSNFLAVTKQTQALRFGNQGTSAPMFDLSDYVMKGANGPLSASLGHVSFGTAKHLINGIASRGVTAGLTIGRAAELSVGALNGTSIVGWDNPLGLARSTHRVFGASLKVDALKRRPGAILFDLSLLSGAQLPQSGFNEGLVNDREKNRGASLHFGGKTQGDRLTFDAGYTVSRFENPVDPTLSQGLTLVAVEPATKAARFADVSVALLRNTRLTQTIGASLSATLRHERVDPLYRSLAAAVQANLLQNVLDLTGTLGPLAVQASHARGEDNLDDIASVLKTFTHVTSFNVALPVGSLFSASKPSYLFPQLAWTSSRTHQFADDVPVNADFAESHAPDQVSDNQSVDVQWTILKWRGGYRYNTSAQDNRQPGREKADLDNLAHNVVAAFSPKSWLDMGASFAFEGANNREASQENTTRRIGVNLDVRAMKNLGLSGVFSRTWLTDDPRTSESSSDDVSVELSQSFRLLRRVADRPAGRLFLRYQRQSAATTPFVNLIRGDRVLAHTWALNSGVSLNAF